jgi:hypothetical protein
MGLNDQRRHDLIDAVLASDVDGDSKVIVARARTDCR